MIGTVLFCLYNDYEPFFIENTFKGNFISLWLAPAEGLLLDRITFEAYNNKNNVP